VNLTAITIFRSTDPTAEPALVARKLPQSRYIRFGSIQVDLRREKVTRDGTPIHLSKKAYRILFTLLQNPRQVVPRERLCQSVWPIEVDIDKTSNLNTTINKLRKSLGDCSRSPVYIETVARKGYMLIVDIQPLDHLEDLSALRSGPAGLSGLSRLVTYVPSQMTKSGLSVFTFLFLCFFVGSLFGAAIWIIASPFLRRHLAP
jgi:DNA-binding winged helix-turn-helix (wHTH) protein